MQGQAVPLIGRIIDNQTNGLSNVILGSISDSDLSGR